MPRCDVTQRALADLRDIARYTRETWGLKQARLYRGELELGIPEARPRRPAWVGCEPKWRSRVWSFPIARHVAFHVRERRRDHGAPRASPEHGC